MKLTVLCLNDYPIGVYESYEAAEQAALEEWRRREPRWKEQGLRPGETLSHTGGKPHTFTKYCYHYHEFELGAEARL